MSTTEYRHSRRPTASPDAAGAGFEDDDAPTQPGRHLSGSLRVPPVEGPTAEEIAADPALTRAPTQPMTPEVLAASIAAADGDAPPEPAHSRLGPSAPTPVFGTPIPGARVAPRGTNPPLGAITATFGSATLVIVPAGDRVAIVAPGAVRLTGTREEAAELAAVLLSLQASD
ncbi:MAG: hypothetical protein R3B06_03580 [Kofleriaceae bacterium]